ncbi:MAG: helix-turn-helix domain-containing protein [Streptosporangiaceae bacterium]
MNAARNKQETQRWTAVVDGKRLRQLRRQRGLAREELAAQAGISSHTLSRLERQRKASCRTRTLARLAGALGEEPSSIAPGIGRHAL